MADHAEEEFEDIEPYSKRLEDCTKHYIDMMYDSLCNCLKHNANEDDIKYSIDTVLLLYRYALENL